MPLNVQLRNASSASRHKQFSFQGVPSGVWYMKTWESAEEWTPTFGTIITITTSEWVGNGAYLQICVMDRDGNMFHNSCYTHRKKTGQTSAFIFREASGEYAVYPQNVSNVDCRFKFSLYTFYLAPGLYPCPICWKSRVRRFENQISN